MNNDKVEEFLKDLISGLRKTCYDYLENTDDNICDYDCPLFHICMRMNLKIRDYEAKEGE